MAQTPGELDATVFPTSSSGWEEPTVDAEHTNPEQLGAGALLASRYEVLALLGMGGMGSVYRARDRELDEMVALKVLRRELSRAPGMLERFRREVKLARRVTHPNVARTFDIGEAGELRFITMELLDGAPLSRHVACGCGWSIPRLAQVASAICAGLGAAHAAGVVHRDLKPDNVILERTGRVVITDFGIARALDLEGASNETQGAVVGTPVYMAPEQIAHDAAIGPAADIYAFGCMLYELASGTPPWSGPTPLAIAAARLLAAPPDLRDVLPAVDPGFARLVLAMMDRSPARRPGSVAEIAEVLSGFASATPAGSRAPAPSPSSPGAALSSPGVALSSPGVAMGTPRSIGGSLAAPTHWGAPKTVAVLPLENRGPAEDDYLAAGLTDDLADLLSGSSGLRVRPRAVAALAAERSRDPRDAGRELGVQVVVSGELRRQGDLVLATVRLITVEDGFQLWAQRFPAEVRDFMRVADEAAAAMAAALLARPMPPRAAPDDPEALDLYMRGRYLLGRMWGSTLEAVGVLTRALELSPHDRRIRIAYARASIRGFAIGALPHDRAVAAGEILDAALREDPRDAEAQHARAQLHLAHGESVAGATVLRSTVELSPDLEPALALLGEVLVDVGLPAPAARALRRARELDPTHFDPITSLARVAALEGDFARVREIVGELPTDPLDAKVYWAVRARFALWAGDREEAARVRAALAGSGPTGFLADVAEMTTAATLGLPGEELIARARRGLDPRAGQRVQAFHLQFRAEVLCGFGELDEALAAVAAADAHGSFDVAWIEHCQVIEPLRRMPGFAAIHERVSERAERIRAILVDVKLGG